MIDGYELFVTMILSIMF